METNRHPKDQDEIVEKFERRLALVERLALGAAGLHNLTWFLGFCALTWASMVLLGGLVSFLGKPDFYLVTILLLLEALRFVEAVFFSNLVTRTLQGLTFARHKLDRKRTLVLSSLRMIAAAGQLLFVSPSIAFPVIALRSVHYQNGTSPFNSIDASLNIFYYLVLINACIATISLFYSLIMGLVLRYLSKLDDESLQRYYDEVLWRGACNGLLQAMKFRILDFVFEVQAQEYSRSMQPTIVQRKYFDLIWYVFNNPHGIESACISFESDDPYQQQAAANIVGLWATIDKGKKLRFQMQLLSKLADKLNLGKTGWAAASSFKSLGDHVPDVVFQVKNQKGKKVVDILMDEIDPANSLSMNCVRAMIPLVEKLHQHEVPEEKISELNKNLSQIVHKETVWVAERITAGYALHRQGKLTDRDKNTLKDMRASVHDYYLKEDKQYLIEMLGDIPEGCRRMPEIDADHDNEQHYFLAVWLFVVVLVWLCVGVILTFLPTLIIHSLEQ